MLQEKKYIRGNDKPFKTKALSKSIMEKARLRKNFLKNPIVANKLACTKQRNFYVSLLRKVKRKYFANLTKRISLITRNFGKISSLFSLKKINLGKK